MSILSELQKRRLVRFVVAYCCGGWAVLQLVDQLADRGVAPELAYRIALVLVICGIPGAIIVSWFHGARGAQRVPTIE